MAIGGLSLPISYRSCWVRPYDRLRKFVGRIARLLGGATVSFLRSCAILSPLSKPTAKPDPRKALTVFFLYFTALNAA